MAIHNVFIYNDDTRLQLSAASVNHPERLTPDTVYDSCCNIPMRRSYQQLSCYSTTQLNRCFVKPRLSEILCNATELSWTNFISSPEILSPLKHSSWAELVGDGLEHCQRWIHPMRLTM